MNLNQFTMEPSFENTKSDKIKIAIAFFFIGAITLGVLMVAAGLFDYKP